MALVLTSDYVEPAELTGYVRGALEDRPQNRFVLERYLPDRPIDDLQYRFEKGGGGLTEAATYRSYDSESPRGTRPGLERVRGELPPISRKLSLGEYDQLQLRRSTNDTVRRYIFRDAERLTRQIAARVEIARGDALVNGQVTINENGVQATVSFGRSGTHSVTAAASWALAATDIITDLVTWRDVYVATNGVRPGRMMFSTKILGYIMRNEGFRELAGSLLGTPKMVSEATIRSVFDMFGLPPYELNDEQVKVAGVATRIIPEDALLFLPEPTENPEETELGATLWGTTLEASDPRYSLETPEGIVAGSYKDEDPMALWTKAVAIVLPVVANPDLTFKADVVP